MKNPSEHSLPTGKRSQALLQIPDSALNDPVTWKDFLLFLDVLWPDDQEPRGRQARLLESIERKKQTDKKGELYIASELTGGRVRSEATKPSRPRSLRWLRVRSP